MVCKPISKGLVYHLFDQAGECICLQEYADACLGPASCQVFNNNSYKNEPRTSKTSENFIKCCLDNFSMGLILFYGNLSICENK